MAILALLKTLLKPREAGIARDTDVRNVQVDGKKAIEKRLLEGPGRSAAPNQIRTAKDAQEL